MCPWEQSQVKFFFQNSSTIPYFPPHSEKNSNLGEGLSARLSNCTLLVQKNVFRKNFFVSVKPFYFHQFWNLNKNILEPSSENSENCSTLNCICRVECHIRSFLLWKKKYSHQFFLDFDTRNLKTQNKTFDSVCKAVLDVSRGF